MAKNLNIENIKNIEKILLPLINAFQNDEKEKLNHLGNISKSLIEVREKVKAEMEKLPPLFNLLDNIRNKNSNNSLQRFETYNSDLLRELLITNFKYKDKEGKKEFEVNFTKLFLEFMNDKFKNKIDLNNISWKKSIIDKEYVVKIEKEDKTTNRRIDLIICYNDKEKSFAVIIENKTKRRTGDQDSQIKDYYDKISKEYKNVYAIYLTPEGKEPSENSLPEEYYKKENGKLYGKFANIKHAEIGYWLESILKRQEFSFLSNEEENNKYNYKLLKSALIQIIDNEKSISGENEENNMQEEEIKKVLDEKLFKELESKGQLTKGKLDEYIEMFDKVKDLLVKEKIQILIKFTKEIANYLKSKNYKEGKDYKLLSDEDIINIMSSDDGYAHDIELNINDILIWVESCWNGEDGIQYYFGIFTEDENKINQIKKKQLKTAIENIFNNFEYEYYEEKGWIFISYIKDIEKDKPKEIAQAMIDLYELLKKEIR